MRKSLLILLAAAALTIGAPASAAQHATKTVSITRTAFVPNSVSIFVGDSVTWMNSDTIDHQVISQAGGFASPVLKPGETFTHVFDKAGKFGYKDALSTKTGNGSVTVAAQPVNATLSLHPSATAVVYDVNSVQLTGQLSLKKSGQQVTLSEQALGEAQAKALATTTTDANGEFAFTVAPSIRTVYTAHWQVGNDQATSTPVTVAVHPRVGLGLIRHRGTLFTYRAKATSDLSYAGHVVSFQRYATSVGGWITIKRVVLGSTSSKIFSVRLRLHVSKVRVFLPTSQAGEGYIWGVSRSLLAIR
jgi:plastocyanin